MTNTNVTNDASTPELRSQLLAVWNQQQRARTLERERLQQAIYIASHNISPFERALAIYNGSNERVDDATGKLKIVNDDIVQWDIAIRDLAGRVSKDRDAAAVEASRKARPEYLKRLNRLCDACGVVWDRYVEVAEIIENLRVSGHQPSQSLLPDVPLSILPALNSKNPVSQLAGFKRLLSETK